MRYLLNSAVITAPGRYDYVLVDRTAALRWYVGERSRWSDVPTGAARLPQPISTIGYAETAAALSALLSEPGTCGHCGAVADPMDEATAGGTICPRCCRATAVEIAVDRRTITMEPGDEALVFRLVFPPGTPRIDPRDKGALGQAILAGHYELGLLCRTA